MCIVNVTHLPEKNKRQNHFLLNLRKEALFHGILIHNLSKITANPIG